MFQGALMWRQRSGVISLIALTILTAVMGCGAVINGPSVSPDGTIKGGDPRLSGLLRIVSANRPPPVAGVSDGVVISGDSI